MFRIPPPTGRPRRALPSLDRPFVAIDFETADTLPDSACAVALVRVEEGEIRDRYYTLIRPPRPQMLFTHIHGLRWEDVESAPRFPEIWPEMEAFMQGAAFLAAHNAQFDRRVLRACCEAAGLKAPPLDFVCTVALARKTWKLFPTRLPDVCRHLDIPLNHHQALSDAEACARIVIAAGRRE
ncbi:MAG TPA: 3'-5' exonuclease [Fredinandcohnia sp.]|nr:3'-5' exonuclease [Fredinandcohnia sp.]